MADDKRGEELMIITTKASPTMVPAKYEPPHNITPLDGVIQSDYTFNRRVEDNEKYDEGYRNARGNKRNARLNSTKSRER